MDNSGPGYFDEFEAIAEAVPGIVLIARDRECRDVIGNRTACAFFRVAPGTNLSRSPPHCCFCRTGVPLAPDDLPLQRAARGEFLANHSLEARFDDGTIRHLHGNAIPLYDGTGSTRGAVSVYADTTERMYTDRALRESEARLRFTLQAARIGTWHWDIASGAVHWSDDLESIHEMRPGSFGGTFESFMARVHPDQRDQVLETIQQALARGGDYRIEYREIRDGGKPGWIEGRGRVELDADGNPTGIIGISMDISERKQAEEALHESEERQRFTLEAARIGIWRLDKASGELECSGNLEAIYGLPPGSLDGTIEGLLQGVHPDDREPFRAGLDAALRDEREYWLEHRVRRQDGAIGWVECRGRVERDDAGRAVRLSGICMDATERKRAEGLLRRLAEAGATLASSLDYETTLGQVADTVVPGWGDWCVVDLLRDGELETVAVAHTDPAKVEQTRALRLEYPSRLDAPTGVGYVVRTGESICRYIDDSEIHRVAVDARHFELLQSLGLGSAVVVPLVARGRILGALTLVAAAGGRRYTEAEMPQVQELARRCAVAVDNARLYGDARRELEQRKRTEEELKRLNETLEQRVTRRTAQLRNLAGELARAEQRERRRLAQALHDDHQQLLVAARLHLGILLHADDPRSEVPRLEQLLDEAVQSARTVSRELSPAVLYDAGLAAALRWYAGIQREKYGLEVHVDADDSINPEAEEVGVFLYQAVRELLLNTVKHADTNEAWIRMRSAEGDWLRIDVRDHGRGFDPERRLEAGAEGGQFGLFGMRERLSLVDGSLTVTSTPGKGTQVTMLVPRAGRECRAPEASLDTATSRLASQPGETAPQVIRVLLADDHKMLRDGLAGLLEPESDIELVAQAQDGQEAISLACDLQPDVVVMDVSMPRVNGLEATRRIRECLPKVAVIGLSMHDNTEIAEAMRNAGAVSYVTKGGAADELVSEIRAHGRRGSG